MEEFYHPRTVWVPLGILLGSGTLFAVLTLQWQRCFVTLSTATFGSAIITVTVDYFIELFALVNYIYERLRVGSPARLSYDIYVFKVTLRRLLFCGSFMSEDYHAFPWLLGYLSCPESFVYSCIRAGDRLVGEM